MLAAAVGVLLLFAQPALAQSANPGRRAPSHRSPAPSGGQAPARSPAAGTRPPSWAESKAPPASHGRKSGGTPRTNSAPGLPGDDPSNVPLGGAEWLAAAGAAYAVRRLQKGATDSEDEDT